MSDNLNPEGGRDPAAVQARMADWLKGYRVGHKIDPPMVTWRCGKCRGRILRVYATPRGWLLLCDDFRVSLAEWLARTGSGHTIDDVHAGKVVVTADARTVKGHEKLLPLDTDEWPAASFEAGCKCGPREHALSLVREHVEQFSATRRRVNSTIPREHE